MNDHESHAGHRTTGQPQRQKGPKKTNISHCPATTPIGDQSGRLYPPRSRSLHCPLPPTTIGFEPSNGAPEWRLRLLSRRARRVCRADALDDCEAVRGARTTSQICFRNTSRKHLEKSGISKKKNIGKGQNLKCLRKCLRVGICVGIWVYPCYMQPNANAHGIFIPQMPTGVPELFSQKQMVEIENSVCVCVCVCVFLRIGDRVRNSPPCFTHAL
jgi:hypothetical protein